MARDHARILCTIWNDKEWRRLSATAKTVYVQLLSQPRLSYAGLLDLAVKRWASAHEDISVQQMRAALSELDAARFLVVDHDTEELVVRTLIRNDGIDKQPQVLAAALRQSFEIESPILRSAVAAELRRLPVDLVGQAPAIVAAALEAGEHELPPAAKAAMSAHRKRPKTPAASEPPVEPALVPADNDGPPARHRFPDPAGTPSANPSHNPSAQAQGEGGRGQGTVVVPVAVAATRVGGPPRAHVSAQTREAAARLVAENTPTLPKSVARQLVEHASALLVDGEQAEHVAAGLRRWSGKTLPPRLLPELVGEAMRGQVIAATNAPRSRADEAVAATLAMAQRVAVEDNDQSAFGRLLRGETPPADGQPAVFGELLGETVSVVAA
ncbi:hypothetical protein [Kutzneria buriramensis]|uniref:Uncharacterized protein n=1 Tax=Kutzneria buriramensis TaxID=1045776 RepID=A0A3E0HD38_9PSEU|nr:hypothetical protein [Kutzneria buriramensis]REH42696.1 hypothetical protein BCF44_110193 [Kutzneria buriramensis]